MEGEPDCRVIKPRSQDLIIESFHLKPRRDARGLKPVEGTPSSWRINPDGFETIEVRIGDYTTVDEALDTIAALRITRRPWAELQDGDTVYLRCLRIPEEGCDLPPDRY